MGSYFLRQLIERFTSSSSEAKYNPATLRSEQIGSAAAAGLGSTNAGEDEANREAHHLRGGGVKQQRSPHSRRRRLLQHLLRVKDVHKLFHAPRRRSRSHSSRQFDAVPLATTPRRDKHVDNHSEKTKDEAETLDAAAEELLNNANVHQAFRPDALNVPDNHSTIQRQRRQQQPVCTENQQKPHHHHHYYRRDNVGTSRDLGTSRPNRDHAPTSDPKDAESAPAHKAGTQRHSIPNGVEEEELSEREEAESEDYDLQLSTTESGLQPEPSPGRGTGQPSGDGRRSGGGGTGGSGLLSLAARTKIQPTSTAKTRRAFQETIKRNEEVRTKRLMKELRDVQKIIAAQKYPAFTVELIDNNLFEWCVRLHLVDPESALARDMVELGVACIELCFEFPDNFPFLPPFVRVLSPHVEKGFVMEGGAICLELLTPAGWASAYTVEAIIVQVTAALSKGQARINLQPKASKQFSRKLAETSFKSLVKTHNKYGWVTPPKSDG